MKANLGITLLAGIAIAALPALGQSIPVQQAAPDQTTATASAIPPDQQATKEQVEKMMEVLRVRKQMETMMNLMPQIVAQTFQTQVKSINAKLSPGKRLTARDQAALQKVMNKYMQEALGIYPIDEMIADAVPVYQRHISKTDCDAVIAFYSSPAGQRLLDEVPAVMQEYTAIVMSHMQARSKHLTDQMVAEIQEIVKPELTGKRASNPKG